MMTKQSRISLAVVLVLVLAAAVGSRVAGFPAASLLTATRDWNQTAVPAASNPRVQTIQFESKLVDKILPYSVLLPVNYNDAANKTKRYAVVYLLHGLTGHYTNWIDHTQLVKYSEGYQFIIVTPEGNNSWYTDSATVAAEKYESYIVQELIPDVEKRFRVNDTRDARAIGGLSMGGYGALKFGMKYPDKFVLAASLSGALDAASWKEAELRGFESIWRTLQPVFGAEDSETRARNDLKKLARELPAERIAALPFLYLDCGTEDPLLKSNRDFVEILMGRKIPHEYRQLPGGHSWKYWDAQVQEILRLASKKLQS
jgi:putative tributyrin esterase